MDFKFIAITLLHIVQIGVFFWGAWYLKREIHLKDSQIETLKISFDLAERLLKIYNTADDFKKYVDIKLETKDLEYKKAIDDLEHKANFNFSEDNPELIKVFNIIREDWSKKQTELIKLVGYFILQADIKQREEILSTIPFSRSLIEEILVQIEKNKK